MSRAVRARRRRLFEHPGTNAEHMLPRAYYAQSMVAAQADQRVLKDLIAERMPKINNLLERLEIDLSLVTFNWCVDMTYSSPSL